MAPTSEKFQYNILDFPFFYQRWQQTSCYSDTYRNKLTRKFFRNIRNSDVVPDESEILDEYTGLTYGEMALYIIHSKNIKRIIRYHNNKKKK